MGNKPVVLTCKTCGKEFVRHVCHIKRREHNYCSRACYAEGLRSRPSDKCPHWKGGARIQDGYVFKKQPDRSYKGEHRALMEEALGRPLSENEVVHHIDGNKRNNDLSNLVVMTRAEHMEHHRADLKRAINDHAAACEFGRRDAVVGIVED